MQISKNLKRLIYWELGIPLTLLTIGIYHGLMQTIYRAGVIHQSSFAHLDYYQGLTLHGVINAIVLTSFFAVAFGHATMAFYLKKEPHRWVAWLSFWLMTVGTVMAAWAMLSGKASVLYTFYPPLKAHPLFYLGAALLIVGSWIPSVQLGEYVYELEKRKSGNQNTVGRGGYPGQLHHLVRLHTGGGL